MNAAKALKLALVVFFAASLLLSACSNSAVENNNAAKNLVFVQENNPVTLDPMDGNDDWSYTVMMTMYEGLLSFDKDMKVIPVLAEALPEISKDAQSITFKLRQGVTFQDGEKFNAEAVKTNFERIKNPENRLKRTSLFSVVEKLEIIDDYTVRFVLNKPFAPILQTFANPAFMMISPKEIKENNKGINRKPVGTGPFQFVEWKDGDHLTVKKFEGYWDQANVAKVDEITFKPATEAASRVVMLQTGEAQLVFPLPYEQVGQLKKDSEIEIMQSPSIAMRYMAVNTQRKPFDDKRVRQALTYAINKDALIKTVTYGYAVPAKSVMAEKVWGFQKQEMHEYDMEKAKQLLAEAGYPNGFETTIWSNNTTERVRTAEFIQQQWKEIGVKATVQPMESATWSNQTYVKPGESKLQATVSNWTPATGEADWAIRPVLTKEGFPPGLVNIGFYSNEQVEKDIQDAMKTTDEKARLDAYGNAQKIAVEEAAIIPLFVPDNLLGKKKNLSGIEVLPHNIVDLRRAEFN